VSLPYYLPRKGVLSVEQIPGPGQRARVTTDIGNSYLVRPGLLWLLRGRLAILTYYGGPKRGRVVEERIAGLLDDDVLIGRDGPAPVGVLRMMRGMGLNDGGTIEW